MKRNHATAAYALTQISIWGTYGFLFTYANPYMTERLGLTDTLAGWLLCACVFLQVQPSFSNALGMEGIHGGMNINFAVARGIGSVSFGVAAKLAALLIGVMGMTGASLLGAASSLLLVAAVLLMPRGSRLTPKTEEAPTSAWEFFRESPKMAVLLVGIMLL